MKIQDALSILGLNSTATQAEIKAAYKRLIIKYHHEYKGLRLVDIPDSLGGVLPAVISYEFDDKYSVICLHPEYFNNWALQV
jgi:hypothetical protein